ncbi:MAG: winged helix-turn-helix domain-containing protein [Micromonosporaceae bacterium]|nr:winged helix-turn-helix domain-containing protein [Micromonosporaceae bacterium]
MRAFDSVWLAGWLAEYRETGEEGLPPRKPPGRPPKLQPEHEARIRALLRLNPQQLGFDSGLWTKAMVAEMVEREFGVRLSPSVTGALLHRIEMSPQRPIVRAYEQDPQRVREWKATGVSGDPGRGRGAGSLHPVRGRGGVRSDYHSGTTWAPVGSTPAVYGTGSRMSVNMVSW